MAGASPNLGDEVVIVADSTFDRRYYYSANRAIHADGYAGKQGKVKVYRLDVEASNTLDRELRKATDQLEAAGEWDGRGWSKNARDKIQTVIQNCTGIRRT